MDWTGLNCNGSGNFTHRSGKGSLNEFRLSFWLTRTVTMMISSSVGGLAGSRSKITSALRKPPTERVRAGWRAGVWPSIEFEARRGSSWAGIAVVANVVVFGDLKGFVEARIGVGFGM